MSNPGNHQLMRGNGDRAYNGWPTLPKLEALRDEWLYASDRSQDGALARKMQEQAFEGVPYLPVGSYYQPVAYRSNLTRRAQGPRAVHRHQARLTLSNQVTVTASPAGRWARPAAGKYRRG